MPVKEENFKDIILKFPEIAVFPQVAIQVINTVTDEESSAKDLFKIISVDQALTTRILKIANSAFYGHFREINSLSRAITILGFKAVKNLVVAVSTKYLFKETGLTERILWDHSVGVAIACQILANNFGDMSDIEESLISGLLHDIGKVAMNNYDVIKFNKIMEKVYYGERLFTEVEKEFYGFSHAELGGSMIRMWNLPEGLEEVVANHHNFSTDCSEELNISRRIAFVNLADLICLKLGIGYKKPRDIVLEEQDSSIYLGLKEDQLKEVFEEVEKTYIKEKELFN